MRTKRYLAAFAVAALLLGASVNAHAQSLQAAFDFTKYGTVAGGSTITSNVYGNTTGVLQTASTSLTSGGLAIAGGTNAGTTGLQLSTGSLNPFTGDFSIQQFYTNAGTPAANSFVMGGVWRRAN